jgi:TATA-binding protein-associated factor Taf7
MATNREMLKEAIADAKAVKETAIANAKVALEEAFTPQLKSMFAAKLQEMESEEDELEEAGFGGMTPSKRSWKY